MTSCPKLSQVAFCRLQGEREREGLSITYGHHNCKQKGFCFVLFDERTRDKVQIWLGHLFSLFIKRLHRTRGYREICWGINLDRTPFEHQNLCCMLIVVKMFNQWTLIAELCINLCWQIRPGRDLKWRKELCNLENIGIKWCLKTPCDIKSINLSSSPPPLFNKKFVYIAKYINKWLSVPPKAHNLKTGAEQIQALIILSCLAEEGLLLFPY